ncbi:MAG TPA: hypothetical protein VFK73_05095 [Paludibacter sp.]|nr:hypothetical protein [Paludibacter sp.]
MSFHKKLKFFKPGIPKRYLIFVAALMWTFAGGMLFTRGFGMLLLFHRLLWLKILISIIAGLIFYFLLFSKISYKHTQRIIRMNVEKPCIFSFFNLRSYIMMVLMIGMGITLRSTGIVPMEYLSVLYVTMGVPLTMSAFRFYYYGFRFRLAVTLFG